MTLVGPTRHQLRHGSRCPEFVEGDQDELTACRQGPIAFEQVLVFASAPGERRAVAVV